MLMSEQDAKTKWCPHARSIDWETFRDGEKPVSANRHEDGAPHRNCLCLASGCANWAWGNSLIESELTTLRGFCGLAGRR